MRQLVVPSSWPLRAWGLRSPSYLRPILEAVRETSFATWCRSRHRLEASGLPWESHPKTPTPLSPYVPRPVCPCCLQWCRNFVRVVRQGVPSRALRKVHRSAQVIRRDDETRRRPAHQSLSSRRRPPASHPDGPREESGVCSGPKPRDRCEGGAGSLNPRPQELRIGDRDLAF